MKAWPKLLVGEPHGVRAAAAGRAARATSSSRPSSSSRPPASSRPIRFEQLHGDEREAAPHHHRDAQPQHDHPRGGGASSGPTRPRPTATVLSPARHQVDQHDLEEGHDRPCPVRLAEEG